MPSSLVYLQSSTRRDLVHSRQTGPEISRKEGGRLVWQSEGNCFVTTGQKAVSLLGSVSLLDIEDGKNICLIPEGHTMNSLPSWGCMLKGRRCLADEGDFVNLQQKHNFSMAHFGMMLGMLRCTLTELQIQHCNDFFSMGQGALSAISCLPRLRVLRVEDLHCRVDKAALAELARLTQVRTRASH